MKMKTWLRWMIGGSLGSLFLAAGMNFLIDPYFHYRAPNKGITYQLRDERYQNDGIVKNFSYDAILTGTSMVENFKTSQFDRLFGTQMVKVPFAGGGYQEIGQNLERAFQNHKGIQTVLWGMDYNNLLQAPDWSQYASYPTYLYDDDPSNDLS